MIFGVFWRSELLCNLFLFIWKLNVSKGVFPETASIISYHSLMSLFCRTKVGELWLILFVCLTELANTFEFDFLISLFFIIINFKLLRGFWETILKENAAKYFHMIIFMVIDWSYDQKRSIKTNFYDLFFVSYDNYSFFSDFLMELRFSLQLVSSPFSVFRISTRGRSASWAQDKNAASYRQLNSL